MAQDKPALLTDLERAVRRLLAWMIHNTKHLGHTGDWVNRHRDSSTSLAALDPLRLERYRQVPG